MHCLSVLREDLKQYKIVASALAENILTETSSSKCGIDIGFCVCSIRWSILGARPKVNGECSVVDTWSLMRDDWPTSGLTKAVSLMVHLLFLHEWLLKIVDPFSYVVGLCFQFDALLLLPLLLLLLHPLLLHLLLLTAIAVFARGIVFNFTVGYISMYSMAFTFHSCLRNYF